jgi:adenylate kinase
LGVVRALLELLVRDFAATLGTQPDGLDHPPARDDVVMEPTIALLGPPGCGKGTQAARLRDELGFAALATGDLLREARMVGTALGGRASEYMDRGDLVPDDLIVAMIRDAIASLDDKPIVIDGFPRTVAQADALAGVLKARSRELTAVVLVDVPDDVVLKRISGRRQGREDDRPETVRERLRVYHRQTEPLVAYYSERRLLRRVEGARDADAVQAGVRAALE